MQSAAVGITLAANIISNVAVFANTNTPSDSPAPQSVSDVGCETRDCVKEMIRTYSKWYGVKQSVAMQVAECESQFRTNATGDSGKAYGPYQFHRTTFDLFTKKMGEKLDYRDPQDQVKVALWALANGYGSHWTCYTKLRG